MTFLYLMCRKLGLESVGADSHLSALLREEVIIALATFDHIETHLEAIKRFQSYLNDRENSLLAVGIRRIT